MSRPPDVLKSKAQSHIIQTGQIAEINQRLPPPTGVVAQPFAAVERIWRQALRHRRLRKAEPFATVIRGVDSKTVQRRY